MKTYKVCYDGNASKMKGLVEEINANTIREAVENIYKKYLDSNYFPQEDGTILDCGGDVICEKNDEQIYYDGGYFCAEEIK